MVCREPGVAGARTLGMETLRAFGSAYWFGEQSGKEGPWIAPLVTSVVLFYLGILVHLGGRRAPGRPSLLRNLVTAYAVITGLVEILRFIFDVSRYALVYAALHNLAEWGVIGFAIYQREEADRHWWRSQLWILLVSQWIIFAPTLAESGLGAQVTGLLCDWLLLFVWGRLYHMATSQKRKYILFGLLGSIGHLMEILPLVSLLIGIVAVPWIPGCLVISLTTPITFWLYYKMVEGWDASGDPDLVTYQAPAGNVPVPPASLAMRHRSVALYITIALVVSTATLLGPVAVIPLCPATNMKVPPGAVLPHANASVPGISHYTGTTDGHLVDGQVPETAHPALPGFDGGHPAVSGSSNESLCISNVRLTGTTTVTAKPDHSITVRDMIATMPGPVRQEDGNLYYELAWGGPDSLTTKVFESWSSIRSLYKHIYTSPAVARVFFGEAFQNLVANQALEGPFQALVPCSVAEKEAQPFTIPFSTIIDAPMECLWARMDDWSNDYSWVHGAVGITAHTPKLRTLHFRTLELTEIRQTSPLPEPRQPEGGHRLVYYVLQGGAIDSLAEVCKGDLSIMPSITDPTRTVLTYSTTLVAKEPSLTTALHTAVFNDINKHGLPHLQNWGRSVADSAACKGLGAQSKPTTPKKPAASAAAA